ncbi:MAG: DnaJ domain-containing protein [Succinivibrio sp.]
MAEKKPNVSENTEESLKEPKKPKYSFAGTLGGFVLGLLLCLFVKQPLLVPLCMLAGFLIVDKYIYRTAQKNYQLELKNYQSELEKLQKKEQRRLKAAQKKNRQDKASLYENIYTVAGYILATVDDLTPYIQNAEDTIVYFKASEEERTIAVEAFNRALDPAFNLEKYVLSYLQYIGKNRDYINCVVNYAYTIALTDSDLDYRVKDRLVVIAKALGMSAAALKRLFASQGAEARFAREYGKTSDSTEISPHVDSDSQDSSDKNSGSYRKHKNPYGTGSRMDEALEILGLDRNATIDDIKVAHKKMMLKYHPDRLASQGLSEDMIAIYTEKAKAVQVAFEYLKKQFEAVG